MSEQQPLKSKTRVISRDEVAREQHVIEDDAADKCCRYLKYSVCLGAALLIVYLIFSFIGGIQGTDYLPKQNIIHKDTTMAATTTTVTHATGSDPFTNWNECNDINNEPSILAYHIHGVFDGNNQDSINTAMNAFYSFLDTFNKNMKECTFSHSNSAEYQTEICYFPRNFKDSDFPMASNKIFQSTNYAFYIPKSELQESLRWWMQHHYSISNDITFDYVIHSVTGCQFNDHSKWIVNSKDYDYQLVLSNLLCCHNGPSKCTCDIVTYKLTDNNINDNNNDKCLTIAFNDNINNDNGYFTMADCEEWTGRGLGSWREVTYSSDNNLNWFQIENYGDITEPMYMCLTVESRNENEKDKEEEKEYGIGSKVSIKDCSLNQDITANNWISKETKFKWDNNNNQIMFIGNNNNNNNNKDNDNSLCLNVNSKNDENSVLLTLQSCDKATVFVRDFTP